MSQLLKYPKWQPAYLAAIAEADEAKVSEKANEAEAAIFRRLQVITADSDHYEERIALQDAINGLRRLQRDKLGFPDWQ